MSYISHEIKTPLALAHIGLRLLSKKHQHQKAFENEVLDNAVDACSTAVSILNNLLLFEKIENGEMSVEINTIFAKPFLISCLKLFRVQVSI